MLLKVRWGYCNHVAADLHNKPLRSVQWLNFPVLADSGTSGNKAKNPAASVSVDAAGTDMLLSVSEQDAVCFHR